MKKIILSFITLLFATSVFANTQSGWEQCNIDGSIWRFSTPTGWITQVANQKLFIPDEKHIWQC